MRVRSRRNQASDSYFFGAQWVTAYEAVESEAWYDSKSGAFFGGMRRASYPTVFQWMGRWEPDSDAHAHFDAVVGAGWAGWDSQAE
jgi:hypothetical protein